MTPFHQLAKELKTALHQKLPGHQGFFELTHNPSRGTQHIEQNLTKKSAVLIALYPYNNEIFMPLILRPPYDGTHGGQVSFPGGRMEDFDESYERTALREAEEEIGIKALDVEIIGALSEVYIPPSNFWVKPIVGLMQYKPEFYPDAREVAEVIEVPLSACEKSKLEKRHITVRDISLKTFGFEVNNQWIWGATALMLWELMEVIGE